MFFSLRLNIFLYYFITVSLFLGFAYYFLSVLKIENISLLILVFISFIVLSGGFISKLAIEPLAEYVNNLQNLSKETLHELNLPISTIKTNTQMLNKSFTDEKSQKRLERINSACEMLQERYNELDYLIKTQSDADVSEVFGLDELVHERVLFLNKIYPHINFNVSLNTLQILNDKKGLCKVIDNIVDNGVKYSPDSKTIDINIYEKTLTIRDYGVGMDEVELLQIFDNYYQSNNNMQGFGIGLSMVKRFCDKNDITLSFQSKPQIGTTVELKFK
ncbi:HAMP domain-containing histidine kinase [Sulfurimonas sp. SAG-AH-194-C21]|nr:HAMP domain-containing sensor histidine kinase [Sulfurimonas sp. SAG-AH-194-C21]MDF1884067.1 HAMP domain-containing histidine kinase [Sulfurimonas sp. SAG-AH-194-C21]